MRFPVSCHQAYIEQTELPASEMTRSVTTTVVLSNMVVVVATGRAGSVLPCRAIAMTVSVVLWLHGSIVIG